MNESSLQPAAANHLRGDARRLLEAAAVVAILGVALLLRAYNLTSLPNGIVGDEAISGLEGQRILREGAIGPYSPYAAGQPTGPLYLTAVSVALFGNSILAVRLVPVVLGVLTVLVQYLLVRSHSDCPTALVASALLAVMSWHIHFSRIAFPLIAWPLATTLAIGALAEASRRKRWHWWAIAGSIVGLGIYVYNAHPVFLAILALFVCLHLAHGMHGASRSQLVKTASFGLAIVVTSIPMALYAANPDHDYFAHFRSASLFHRPEWQLLRGPVEQGFFLANRYVEFWSRLCCRPQQDIVDGTGFTPIVPLLMLLFAVVGVLLALTRRRNPLVSLGVLVIILMPLASVVSDGPLMRRSFPIAPLVTMFVALGAVECCRMIVAKGRRLHQVATVLIAGAICVIAYENLDNYFVKFARSPAHFFAYEITESARFMNTLPSGSRVYFYSEKWSGNYETRRFLSPNVTVEDRSVEFGRLRLGLDPNKQVSAYVFLGKYTPLADRVQHLYPGGMVVVGGTPQHPAFVAYLPPVLPQSP